MMTLFSFRIVYLCRVQMVNISMRDVGEKVVTELFVVSWIVGVFIYLLLMWCFVFTLIIEMVR
jgi:hypothetical protein